MVFGLSAAILIILDYDPQGLSYVSVASFALAIVALVGACLCLAGVFQQGSVGGFLTASITGIWAVIYSAFVIDFYTNEHPINRTLYGMSVANIVIESISLALVCCVCCCVAAGLVTGSPGN